MEIIAGFTVEPICLLLVTAGDLTKGGVIEMKSSNALIDSKARIDLLDELTRLSGCDFLSNLTRLENRAAVNRALMSIDPRDFTAKAWSDAASYFGGETYCFATTEDARKFLIEKTK